MLRSRDEWKDEYENKYAECSTNGIAASVYFCIRLKEKKKGVYSGLVKHSNSDGDGGGYKTTKKIAQKYNVN
ncbi:hypothetical protein M0804_014807 [Polistes exclamans]|nr:hypothetical protein M0804_014808 [Polistes exclamans]KAI4474525.1 hypothetical protein M0804_014807 [Polistes exclamans]